MVAATAGPTTKAATAARMTVPAPAAIRRIVRRPRVASDGAGCGKDETGDERDRPGDSFERQPVLHDVRHEPHADGEHHDADDHGNAAAAAVAETRFEGEHREGEHGDGGDASDLPAERPVATDEQGQREPAQCCGSGDDRVPRRGQGDETDGLRRGGALRYDRHDEHALR